MPPRQIVTPNHSWEFPNLQHNVRVYLIRFSIRQEKSNGSMPFFHCQSFYVHIKVSGKQFGCLLLCRPSSFMADGTVLLEEITTKIWWSFPLALWYLQIMNIKMHMYFMVCLFPGIVNAPKGIAIENNNCEFHKLLHKIQVYLLNKSRSTVVECLFLFWILLCIHQGVPQTIWLLVLVQTA